MSSDGRKIDSGAAIDSLMRSEVSDSRIVEAVKRYMSLLEKGSAPAPNEFVKDYEGLESRLLPSLEGLGLLYPSGRKPSRDSQEESDSRIDRPNHNEPSHETAGLHQVPTDKLPEKLGDFRILREIGRGGMGIVYEAEQLSLNRRVALKVLSFASALDMVRLQRFRNEAQAAAGLHHSHIVPVYAVGSDRGVHYYAMQYIEGQTLASLIESLRIGGTPFVSSDARATEPFRTDSTLGKSSRPHNAIRFRTIATMFVQAAMGLDHAHQYGVIHRDIKPANLILDTAKNLWVTDFGLAQIQNDSNLTRTGDMLGTLRYMSPEQASGGEVPVDHRTDIYSLGATLYEMLTLSPAITAQGHKQILSQISDQDPVFPCDLDQTVPRELSVIATKALAKRPVDRYSSAKQFADDLQRWLDDKPILAKPPTWLQRIAKWRRRHTGLVNAAVAFAILAGIGLFASAVLIFREQRRTAAALSSEIVQRQSTEARYQQAKRAVDTFTAIVESELAFRPDLISVRREFLDVSLEFYRDFLDAKRSDIAAQNELTANAEQFKRLLDTLAWLNKIEPLPLLEFDDVRNELELTPEQLTRIRSMLEFGSTEQLSKVSGPELSNATELLSDSQWRRLYEVYRQVNLPFTFKNYETWVALELSREQRKEIGRIIEEERPDLLAKRMGLVPNGFARNMPGEGRGGKSGGPRGRGDRGPKPDIPRIDPFWKPPPPEQRFKSLGPSSDDFSSIVQSQTAKTVARILELLTPEQRILWEKLKGEPFQVRR